MFLMDTRVKNQPAARCGRCSEPAANAVRCAFCGFAFRPPAPKSLVARIKRALGIEISSEILAINLEEDGHFFSIREIDLLLANLENPIVLDLADVPDYDTMFYNSKRIRKPLIEKSRRAKEARRRRFFG